MAARQKPSKKRSVLNMAISTENATANPNTSTDSTDTSSTGIRPNLTGFRVSIVNIYIYDHNHHTYFVNVPVCHRSHQQVAKNGADQQRELGDVNFPLSVTHQRPLQPKQDRWIHKYHIPIKQYIAPSI